MNHEKARQKAGDKLWHYTSANGEHVRAIGHCSPWEECPKCKVTPRIMDCSGADDCGVCHGRRVVRKASPCPGHATAEEARAHQKQYLLDHATFQDDSKEPRSLHRCEVDGCREMTDGSASLPGGDTRTLCKKHRNRETLERVVDVGEAWTS